MTRTTGSEGEAIEALNSVAVDYEIDLGNGIRLECRVGSTAADQLRLLCPPAGLISLSAPQARRLLDGGELWVLSAKSGRNFTGHALAVVERGRLRTGICVTLASEPLEGDSFWKGLEDLASQLGATTLQLETVSAHADLRIPALASEQSRYEGEHLYVVDLRRPNESRELSKNTRRNINKAVRAGAGLIELAQPAAFDAHLRLTSASLDRRAERGEDVAMRASSSCVLNFLNRGLGRLYQAGIAGQVMSSKFVFFNGPDAFYYDGGTSAEGMENGLSHFLMDQVIQATTNKGCEYLNLDLARAGNLGLMRFKEGFDSQLWFVSRVTANRESPLRLLRNVLRWR